MWLLWRGLLKQRSCAVHNQYRKSPRYHFVHKQWEANENLSSMVKAQEVISQVCSQRVPSGFLHIRYTLQVTRYTIDMAKTQSTLESRINRLVGQIEGIRRMINSGRDCEDVAQQILAAREALSKIGVMILKEGICKNPGDKKTQELLEKVFRI